MTEQSPISEPPLQHTVSVTTNAVIFALLMLLLVLTVWAAFHDLGAFNTPIALLIATTKTVLIMLYFMHIRFSNRLVWIFAGAAFLWLGILMALSLSDYLTRGWLGIYGK
jgi:cytochrome c oxidase subunit IV